MENKSRFNSRLLLDNREIRVFLSSTFSDMQEERSALVKTFDKLKIAALRRNVTLSLLDLRWGVTDDEARSGKVISVCLNEIERSHPFFIGLLGNHYGTPFASSELSKNPDLLERYPWLAEDIGSSITEIEMLYGVLRNTDNPVDAAFYIKQTPEPDDNPRQTSLKRKIYGQQRFPVEDYSSIEELCTFVEQEVTAMLDRHFPDGERSPLERERNAQRAYINSRHNNFVGREEDLDYIDSFVSSDNRYLVITGDSGMGKSALLANWIKRSENRLDFNLAYHFVGNSFAGNSYESILRHLCDEIYDIYHIEKEPNRKEKPEEEAQRLVDELICKQKPLVVIIDGINQISATTNEKLLLWLPVANNKVKFIFTTLSNDQTMDAFGHFGHEVTEYTLGPLTKTQLKKFAIDYLDRVGKHVDEEQMQRIINDPENMNTLVLRTLLDELICFGSYEQLNERINRYLDAASIPDFFNKVLQRMEEDYDNGQDLVKQTLTLIALSEHGLSETEIISITKTRPMDWHLFYCAFFNHIVVKEGLVTFSHQYVATAVAKRYATYDTVVAQPYRLKIVNYFSNIDAKDEIQNQRRISELAHQYRHLADWSNLHRILLSFDAYRYFSSANEFLLASYWRALLGTDKEQYKLNDYLMLPYQENEAFIDSFNAIGLFVSDYFAVYNTALEYHLKALEISKKVLGTTHPCTAISYNNIGLEYHKSGDYDKALRYYLKALEIKEKDPSTMHPDTVQFYNNIGLVYQNKGIYEKALEYYLKALETSEKVLGVEHPYTATSYHNIGTIYDAKGDFDMALKYYLKALMIREKVLGTNHHSTASTYNNIGLMYQKLDDYDKALEYNFKALGVWEEILGKNHPDTATLYNNIGILYYKKGDYDTTLEYYLKALQIRETVLGITHPDTAQSHNNIGMMYYDKGNYDKALKHQINALEIWKKGLGTEHPNIATSYNNLGLMYHKMGDYENALKYHFKALEINEKVLGTNHYSTAVSYNNIGLTYHKKGNYDKALEYYLKALHIWEKALGIEHTNTATLFDNIGLMYKEKGDYDMALEYYFKALETRERILGTDHPNTAQSYNNIGLMYQSIGDHKKAMEYCLKAMEIYERVLGTEHTETATSYNNIGGLYDAEGNYNKALDFYSKALEIRERILGTDHPDTAGTYNNIGLTYLKIGDNDKALEYYLKALEILEKTFGTDHPDTATLYNNIGEVYLKMGDYNKALEYFPKGLQIREKVLGTAHIDTAASYGNMGVLYLNMGDYNKALDYYLKAASIFEKVGGGDNSGGLTLYQSIGAIYYKLENYTDARRYFEKVLRIIKSELGNDHPDVQIVQGWIDATKTAMDGASENGHC